jgi:hypothetical protein
MTRALAVLLAVGLLSLGCGRGPVEPVTADPPASRPTATQGPTPTPTPVYWAGSIRCSFQGGPPGPCPACPEGQSSCTLPPGWATVCLDAQGKVFPCPDAGRQR